MIFTERTITVVNDSATINKPLILYRGDKNIELKITIAESQFKFRNNDASNVIETTDASYAQLVINTPYGLPIFSDVAATKNGAVIFVITEAMIDEIREVGAYEIQIRLLDDNKQSRASIPPVSNAIEIREPIAIEDGSAVDSNVVNVAKVNRALTTTSAPLEAFDSQGNYIKKTWGDGDPITDAALNKMEAGIEGVNNKAKNIPTSLSQLTNDANFVNESFVNDAIAGITGVSTVEPEALDMPKVFFYGNALPTTKDNVNLTMDYISNTAKFSSFIKLKCQGTSSMSYAKKNFTVSMFSDESRKTKLKKDFKGWGPQSKFCLKANYVDTTHTRNLSGAKVAYDMVQSRPDSPFKQQLLQCPRNGAVDGFPIKLYFNGEFYGIYTWNIPKDGWMFNMDESNPNHMVLCAEQNNNGSTVNDNVLRCEFRKEWDGSDGASWSIEFGTLSDALKNSFNRCVNFVMTATDEEFKANIGNYFDLYSLLDYYCFSYLVAHIDGLAKNMLMITYDGVIWGAALYDMDSIYGADWQGAQFKATNIQCPEQYQETNSLLWQRIESCFPVELYARYLELRQGALSLSNIIKHVEEIYDVMPDRVFADEKAKWTSLPGVSVNTMTRFRNYMRDRAAYVDAEMKVIGTNVPCTGIVLSADTLSFTTTDTQTLSVVVSPENCTDAVTWSVSPSGIVTVVDGVVTPIVNGACVITATCGSYSDTCDVTVTLPEIVCTGISLDKTELALGKVSSDASNEVNLLDGAEWSNGALDINNGTIRANDSDKYTQINISTPGKYTLSSTVGYIYKKIALYDTNGTFMCGVGNEYNVNNCVINITKPCVAKIGAYPNNLAWDASALSFTRSKINENITNSDATYTLTSSDINVRYTGSNYVYAEVFLDKKYDDMVIVEFDGNIYGTTTKSTGINNETALNVLATSKNLGYINNYEYYDKTFLNVAFPIAYGTTADEILANMTSTTVTVNPTDELAKIEASATTQILSARLTSTVTPENCTQPVVWSVSPEGIVTVDNGLVRAVTNGEATVTATCGSQSATCAVTVSGMSEYTDISYIESTGTQYINTHIVPTTSTKIELVAEMSASKQYDHIFGSNNFMKAQWGDGTGTVLNVSKKNGNNQFFGLTLGKHTYVMDMADTTNVMTIDGTNYGVTIGDLQDTTYPILLLCGYSPNGAIESNYCAKSKIYSCKIYYEDTLVANMKPVLTNSGTYGLLDTVNNTFYGSEVGSFTGPVPPSGGDTDIYATAEYAITEPRTFNGTSDYIDTGIKLFDTAKDFTLFIDYTPTAGVNQANNTTVFHCVHEASPYRGLCMMVTVAENVYFIGGQGSSKSYGEKISPFDNHKFIIQFANGVISSIKTVNDGVVQDVTLGATAADNPYVQVTENLLLGCYQDINGNKGRYWNGTINKFAVWFKTLTNDEIKILTGCDNIATGVDNTIETTYTNGYIARIPDHITNANGNVSLGEIITTTGDITSDFISCEITDTFTINTTQTPYGCGVVAYDSSQSYLSTYTASKAWLYSPIDIVDIKGSTININNLPENAAYIRICVNTTDSSSVTIIKHSIVYS